MKLHLSINADLDMTSMSVTIESDEQIRSEAAEVNFVTRLLTIGGWRVEHEGPPSASLHCWRHFLHARRDG